MTKLEKTPGGISSADFDKIFNEFHGAVFSFFTKRGFSREDSRDLTQDTFVAAFRGRTNYRGEASAKTWILAIAANIWRNSLRRLKQKKHRAVVVPIESRLEDSGVQSAVASAAAKDKRSEPMRRLLNQERLDQLLASLEALPQQMKLCAYLRYGQEMKYEEIAVLMRTSINTVKSQLYQARERLRKSLDQ